MSVLTAAKTAECLLAFCNEYGDVLTNLKLQKMLYYVQGWHLGLYGSPLFDEPFEAWIHGPEIPEIYRHYQSFGFNPIESDLLPGDERFATVPESVWDHIAEVWASYGDLSAFTLEQLCHKERPWIEARNGALPDEASTARLSTETMRAFFSDRARAA